MCVSIFSKQAEREKKQAEVRARLEATTAQGRKKKGFMTPERKKKLRVSKITSFECAIGLLKIFGVSFPKPQTRDWTKM